MFMSRNNKKFSFIVSLQVISLVLGLLSVFSPKISALTTGSITTCISNSSSYYDSLNQSISGSVYVRLPAGANPSIVYLYSETMSDTRCQLIGGAKAFSGHWTFLANASDVSNIMLQGQGLNAQPYSAVANLLVVPIASICEPVIVCNTTYQGINSSLTPNLLSNTTDQIAVYQANPVTDIRRSSINYYADGTFLYSATQLKPINHDYLPGGTHAVFIQVSFLNGEKININQSVNNGVDWSGGLRLRSDFYRSHNKLVFAAAVSGVIVLLILGLWVVRILYKRHEFKIDHGLDEYEDKDMIGPKDDQNNDPPVVIG
jgi:hypothetical protein